MVAEHGSIVRNRFYTWKKNLKFFLSFVLGLDTNETEVEFPESGADILERCCEDCGLL
jgi:hypothetical protein